MSAVAQSAFQKYCQDNFPQEANHQIFFDGLAVFFCDTYMTTSMSTEMIEDTCLSMRRAIAFVEFDPLMSGEVIDMTARPNGISGVVLHRRLRGGFFVNKVDIIGGDQAICVAVLESNGEVSVVMDTGESE